MSNYSGFTVNYSGGYQPFQWGSSNSSQPINPLTSLVTQYLSNNQSQVQTPLSNQYFASQLSNSNTSTSPVSTNNNSNTPSLAEGFSNAMGMLNNAGQLATGVGNLIMGFSNFKQQKEYNKQALANAKMQNEAMRFELDNRKSEIARLNRIRTNVNKAVNQGSTIKTSY